MKLVIVTMSLACFFFGIHVGLSYYYQAVLHNIHTLETEQKAVFEDIKDQIVRLEQNRVFSQQELLQSIESENRQFVGSNNIMRVQKNHD